MKLDKVLKTLLIIPIVSMPIYCVSCNNGGNIEPEPEPVPETEVSISCESTLIHLDETTTVIATVTPESKSIKVRWVSSNPFVANIDDAGLSIYLHPIKTGSTTIKAEIIKNNEIIAVSNEIEITVDDPTFPSSIEIDTDLKSFTFGQTSTFSVIKVEPETASTAVVWHSSDYNVLSIDNKGIACPVNGGTAKVWASSARDPNIVSNEVTIDVIGANNFETDSWETIIHYANKGYDCLKDTYSDWLSKHNNTFVGATRKIDLTFSDEFGTEVIPHKVRVIGVNHDYLDSAFTKKAPLTFDFVNLITPTLVQGYFRVRFRPFFDDTTSTDDWINNYWIKNDGNICNLGTKLQELMNRSGVLPNWFQINVPFVYKQYHKADGKEQWSFDRLFILSTKEMGNTSDDFLPEGETYEYYLSAPEHKELYEKCLVDDERTSFAYWLRTPHATEDTVAYLKVDLGVEISSMAPNGETFVAPAFCIGRA